MRPVGNQRREQNGTNWHHGDTSGRGGEKQNVAESRDESKRVDTAMKVLYDEIVRRLPEAVPWIYDDEEDPYLVMASLVRWLDTIGLEGASPELISRLVDFTTWCEKYPRGETAEDDLYTALVVAFYEHLFESRRTRPFIPLLLSKEDLLKNAAYLRQWVGKEEFELALQEYNSSTRGRRKR